MKFGKRDMTQYLKKVTSKSLIHYLFACLIQYRSLQGLHDNPIKAAPAVHTA